MNNLLPQRVVDLQRQYWARAQYSRREYLEITGIPRTVDDNFLEEKVIQVFQKIGCNIDFSNIKVCHRITKLMIVDSSNIKACRRITKKNDKFIVKFSTVSDKNCETRLSSPLIQCWLQIGCSFLVFTASHGFFRLGTTLSKGEGEFSVTLSKANVFLWTFL